MNNLYLSFVQLDIRNNAEVDTLHLIGESTEHVIHFTISSPGLNLKKLIFENVFEGEIIDSSSDDSIESISFINIKRLRKYITGNIT